MILNANVNIMDEQWDFHPCDGPLDEIFGVAYTSLNRVYEVSYPTFNSSEMLVKHCAGMDDMAVSSTVPSFS